MSRRLLLCVTLAATITVAGCTADTPPPPPVPPTFDASALRLVAFDSCEQLTKDLRDAAKEAVGPWGLPGSGGPETGARADGGLPGGARDAGDLAAPAAGKAAAPEFSGTNVHEQGVDEPDMVKTDGKRIVTVSGGILRVVDAATRTETGKVALDGQAYSGAELLLAGDKALVLLAGGYSGYVMDKPFAERIGGPTLLLVDLSGAPRVVSRFEGEGQLVDARQTGNIARVVLRSSPQIAFPDQPNQSNEEKRTAANRTAVDKADTDAWLPGWTVTTGADVEKGRVSCAQVSRPPAYSAASMLSVFTFDLSAPAFGNGDPVSVVADGDTVYGTANSLYVVSDQRWRFELRRRAAGTPALAETQIYRFDINGADKPVYAAAGSVPGRPINQYALSEWDGRLRVATTNEQTEKSAVRVLERQGTKLAQVGVVDGLGKGERIYSVRFIGPRGYVVTFKQTDPLYSVDLSNPAKPKVTGELKITGYSSHLQPAGDGRLIGIGQQADSEGRVQGTQVSYFDVSDPASPERLAQKQISAGQSEAEYDPHALLYWPATNLLVVPITEYGAAATGPANAAKAMRVTDKGIEDLGTVTQPGAGGAPERGYAPGIRRSLVIGDTLWTVSDSGLQASSLSTLNQVGWLPND